MVGTGNGGATEINILLVSNQYFSQLKEKNGFDSGYSVVVHTDTL